MDRAGAVWDPHLAGTEMGTTASSISACVRSDIKMEPLSGTFPGPVEFAAVEKQVLGWVLFKELPQWDHVAIYRHHFDHNVSQCQMDMLPKKIPIGDEGALPFRMQGDTGASFLTAFEWGQLADAQYANSETKGGILEFLILFGSLGLSARAPWRTSGSAMRRGSTKK